MTYFDLIVDAGNGNIKAALVKGTTLIEVVTFPSLLRLTPDSLYVYGGFTLKSDSAVIGLDNEDREDVIVIGNDPYGKLKYLDFMLASVISAFNDVIPNGSSIRFHLLTLNFDRRKRIEEAVANLTKLSIDGEDKELKPVLHSLLPEGVGCGLSAVNSFKDAKAVSVLDIGSGTMNYSSYNTTRKGYPRRTSFIPKGVGISQFEKGLISLLESSTTNCQVDARLVRHALVSNTYRLLDSYDGTDISQQVDTAIEHWLSTSQVKELLTKVIFTLQTGGYVSCCGGGFKINKVRDAIETIVLANCREGVNWLIPTNTDVLGVLGVAEQIKASNRKQKTVAEVE